MKTIEIDEIVENFAFLDNWEDRYAYLIELGRLLQPFPHNDMIESNKVQGCISNVWLTSHLVNNSGPLKLIFNGTSDSHILKGLLAIMLSLFSNQPPKTILETDEQEIMKKIHLEEHLTQQRTNGLRSMVSKIKSIASSIEKKK
ncbi:SufE family protein [Candidatus Endowatersipora endosymbiont of Watersipora subatra]|uniref:SufE family protein n=1 Tax=Candidatus Endowatersipora endosymbiont of Watersipora subatra TaxID=3077946 RepID=UPI00312C82B9